MSSASVARILRAVSSRRAVQALSALVLASAALLAVRPAAAQNVQWSIGINLPPVGAVITSPQVFGPPPVIYAPPPRVVYAPPPRAVYVPPPTIYYPPAQVVYQAPPRVVYGYPVYEDGYRGGYDHGKGRGRWKDKDRDGIPDRWERHRRGD